MTIFDRMHLALSSERMQGHEPAAYRIGGDILDAIKAQAEVGPGLSATEPTMRVWGMRVEVDGCLPPDTIEFRSRDFGDDIADAADAAGAVA